MAPDLKFSAKMSNRGAMSSTSWRPSGCLRSMHMLRLLRLFRKNVAPTGRPSGSAMAGSEARPSSPASGSTLTTSAPRPGRRWGGGRGGGPRGCPNELHSAYYIRSADSGLTVGSKHHPVAFSLPGESGFPLLLAGPTVLLEVFGATRDIHRPRLVGQVAVDVGRQAAVQQELCQTDRHGGSRIQSLHQMVRGGLELGRGHRSVDQSPDGGVGTRDLLAQHKHFAGPGHTGQARDEPGGTTVGGETERGERCPESRIVRNHGEVRRP